MADVTLEVIIPDEHVLRVKAAAEGLLANGQTVSGAELKALIEDKLKHIVKDYVIEWEQREGARAAREAAENEVNF